MAVMANRVAGFGTTIFSTINGIARQYNAVNLGQGAPDFDGPPEVLAAAVNAVNNNMNQYAPGMGVPSLRTAIARHAARFYGMQIDPEKQVIITAGATEAMFAAIMGLTDPGDEVIVFEPVYDTYVPNMGMAGVSPRYVPMHAPDWHFDPADLAAAFNSRTKAIIINSPHNPTGKVYSREELTIIAELCQKHNVIAITDEVYEHILYDGTTHTPIATIPGMEDRTLTISSLGKTFSVTGWKIGWAVGNPELVESVVRAHQWITYCVASPLQVAAAAALDLPDGYYQNLIQVYQTRRDFLMGALLEAGFTVQKPRGGYFIVADWRAVGPAHIQDDITFAEWLIKEKGVATIPLSPFFQAANKAQGRDFVRFAVCKKEETLQAAVDRLQKL
jgi:N-succinyldiaminopimelate aminotransferase